MELKLPSHKVPLTLVADIVNFKYIRPRATKKEIVEFCGKSVSYVNSSLSIAYILGMVDDADVVSPFISRLGRTPNENIKLQLMRKYVQEFEPFITFLNYHLNGDNFDDSARKVYTFYCFSGGNYTFLRDMFLAWGISLELFWIEDSTIVLGDSIIECLDVISDLNLNLDDDLAIRLYISNIVSADIFRTISNHEIEELVDAFKKYKIDPRGAIECAGRAFEDFLRRMSIIATVDVTTKNGIGQIINALYNNKNGSGILVSKIHNKQSSVGSAIGDIRNMAGHSLEARTMERWDLTQHSARAYIEIVLSTMRSMYLYITEGTYKL